jgi:pyridoxine 4-dehydrogenase
MKVAIGERRVHRLGFGAMRLPAEEPRAPAIAVARRAVELGVELVDTAFMYGWGANELLLAEALHPYPANVLIATKVGIVQPAPGEWAVCGRPESLLKQAEDCLSRLRLERIDLLQLHRLDPDVPIADQVGVLRDLQAAGKIGQIGLSEVSVSDLETACATAPIASVQNRYSIFERRSEAVVDWCTERGVAFLPWRPVAQDQSSPPLYSAVDGIAKRKGITRAQVALAWLLARSPIIAPIPGTSSLAHLEENCRAVDVTMDDADMRELAGGLDRVPSHP